MRSTGFIFLSAAVHAAAVTMIVMNHPPKPVGLDGDAPVEVTMGEPAPTPGVPEAEAVAQPAPPPPKPVEKPVENVDNTPAKPTKRKAATAKPAPKVSATTTTPAEDKQTFSEDSPVLIPVKDSAPAGVSAAGEGDDDTATEATGEAEANAPSPVAAAVPAAATKNVSALTDGGGELGRGGATKAGAIDYTLLKQQAGNRPPMYPIAARRDKRQGDVELLYRVTNEGHVTEVTIAKSSGSEDLDAAAVKAVSSYRYVPGQEGWARHPVKFSLKGDPTALPSRLRTKVGVQGE